nr:MAG: hypothetical protein DIU58_16760 [Sphaerobacter thermophilus]
MIGVVTSTATRPAPPAYADEVHAFEGAFRARGEVAFVDEADDVGLHTAIIAQDPQLRAGEDQPIPRHAERPAHVRGCAERDRASAPAPGHHAPRSGAGIERVAARERGAAQIREDEAADRRVPAWTPQESELWQHVPVSCERIGQRRRSHGEHHAVMESVADVGRGELVRAGLHGSRRKGPAGGDEEVAMAARHRGRSVLLRCQAHRGVRLLHGEGCSGQEHRQHA